MSLLLDSFDETNRTREENTCVTSSMHSFSCITSREKELPQGKSSPHLASIKDIHTENIECMLNKFFQQCMHSTIIIPPTKITSKQPPETKRKRNESTLTDNTQIDHEAHSPTNTSKQPNKKRYKK